MNTINESDSERKRAAKRSQIYIIIAITFASIFAVVALWCFSQMPPMHEHSPLAEYPFGTRSTKQASPPAPTPSREFQERLRVMKGEKGLNDDYSSKK